MRPHRLGRDLERAQPGGVVEDLAGEHQLVRAGAGGEGGDALADGVRRADHGAGERLVEGEEDALVEARAEIVDRRRQLAGLAGAEVDEGLLERGEQPRAPRALGVGGEDVEGEHEMRLRPARRGAEGGAVDLDRLLHQARREVRGEGVGEAERRGELGAEQARAEHPDLDVGARAGDGADPRARRRRGSEIAA